jgi:hypothetical protein
MNRHRKHQFSTPPLMEGAPSPAEIIEAPGQIERPLGTPVQLIPAGPPVEIIEASPLHPRLDLNRPLVPTESEVANLPRWAKIAFASRCARRLLPLININPGELASDQKIAVATVVRAVEQSAAIATLQAQTIKTAVRVVKDSVLIGDGNDAANAALAAAHLSACNTAQITVTTLQRLANVRTLRFVLLPRRDFDHILQLAKEQNWTDDTPVPPTVFGPMWNREPPLWWRDDKDLPLLTTETKNPEPTNADPGLS